MIEVGEKVNIRNFNQCNGAINYTAFYHEGEGIFLGLTGFIFNKFPVENSPNDKSTWSKHRIGIKVLRDNGRVEHFRFKKSSLEEIKCDLIEVPEDVLRDEKEAEAILMKMQPYLLETKIVNLAQFREMTKDEIGNLLMRLI